MVNKLFLPILLLAPAAYASAQQPVLPQAPQPAALTALLAEVQPAPLAATLSAAQPAARPNLEAALQPATPTAQQPAPTAAPQAVSSSAQPASNSALPRAGSDWQMVESLPAGTTLFVNAKGGHKACKLKSATADMLTCAGTGKDAVYPRAEVWTIKIGHRGRSALIGAIPGGVMVAAGGIGQATENCTGQFFCGLGPAALELGGVGIGVIGAGVGALTDFSKSTIYTAP